MTENGSGKLFKLLKTREYKKTSRGPTERLSKQVINRKTVNARSVAELYSIILRTRSKDLMKPVLKCHQKFLCNVNGVNVTYVMYLCTYVYLRNLNYIN